MKHRPILFSTPMVQAILDGRKTQTRRVVKPHPEHEVKHHLFGDPSKFDSGGLTWECPYGQPGDVLWVRETFLKHPIPDEGYKFKADANKDQLNCSAFKMGALKWKPSIHMPKDAARIYLEITNVRVERLQEISEQDAKAEGIEQYKSGHYKFYTDKPLKNIRAEIPTAYDSFLSLWWSINGKESWDTNPWVWVVEFKRIEKPKL